MSDEVVAIPEELKNVDVQLLVKQFVEKYVKSKIAALDWAGDNIDRRLHPILKPAIRKALVAKGYRIVDKPEGPARA